MILYINIYQMNRNSNIKVKSKLFMNKPKKDIDLCYLLINLLKNKYTMI